jgi:hypothetical protein
VVHLLGVYSGKGYYYEQETSRGSRLIELAIFAVLVLVVTVALVFVTGMTSISAFFFPASATARPIVLAGGLPTPAPAVTRMPAVRPTAVAPLIPASTLAATPTGRVLLISYLRTDPRMADDAVEYTLQQTVEDLVWYRVRVVLPAADCNARRSLGIG